jgi:hypothetical protein
VTFLAFAEKLPRTCSANYHISCNFQESLLLFVPNFSPQDARCASPLDGGHNGDLEAGHSSSGWHKEASRAQQCHFKRPSLLRHCYPSSSVQGPTFSANHVKDCLPPCYHNVKAMSKLIKVSTPLLITPKILL